MSSNGSQGESKDREYSWGLLNTQESLRFQCTCCNPQVGGCRSLSSVHTLKRQLVGSHTLLLPQGTTAQWKPLSNSSYFNPFNFCLEGLNLHEGGQTSQKVFHTPDIWLNSIETWYKSRTWLSISHHCSLGDIPPERPSLSGKASAQACHAVECALWTLRSTDIYPALIELAVSWMFLSPQQIPMLKS